MFIPDWTTEKKLISNGCDLVIGVDEVGRGPLAGPVLACAAALKTNIKEIENEDIQPLWNLVRDSKSVSEKQREKVYKHIIENFYIGIGQCDRDTIDDINILQASFLAMKKAHASLMKALPSYDHRKKTAIILVDGDKKIPNFSQKQIAVPKGDKKIKTIAAASILAKVTRDRIMVEYAQDYPVYGFEKHKGYGTKVHMQALHKYGTSPIHRVSFKPVHDALLNRAINRELDTNEE